MTTTLDSPGRHGFGRHQTAASAGTVVRVVPASLALLGFLTVLISAWGGIVAYVGPSFGYSADGASSWTWTLSHVVLALVPGVLGVLAGLVIWARLSNLAIGGGRIGLTAAGLLALICGAWFVIGPFAWPVIDTTRAYFVPASPLHLLANLVGYSLGTGVILAACGAFALGWAVRHQRPLEAAAVVPPRPTPSRRLFARRHPTGVPPTAEPVTDAQPSETTTSGLTA